MKDCRPISKSENVILTNQLHLFRSIKRNETRKGHSILRILLSNLEQKGRTEQRVLAAFYKGNGPKSPLMSTMHQQDNKLGKSSSYYVQKIGQNVIKIFKKSPQIDAGGLLENSQNCVVTFSVRSATKDIFLMVTEFSHKFLSLLGVFFFFGRQFGVRVGRLCEFITCSELNRTMLN